MIFMEKVLKALAANLLVAALVCSACLLVQAQNREKFVISAKAGGVNSVSGRAMVRRRGDTGWQSLTSKDNLESGDVVKTEAGGLVEVLLNPGTYLRLPADSEFEMADTSLDSLRVRLIRGSAIVEAAGSDGSELMLEVETPQAGLKIVRKGLYRINVAQSGRTEVLVRNGRVLVGPEELKVKGGKMVLLGGGSQEVAKLDKKNQDQFDLWSKERAETLARANQRVSNRTLDALLNGYSLTDWDSISSRGYGLWLYNTAQRCFIFLPFYQGWNSPYGLSYDASLSSFYYYRGMRHPDYNTITGGGSAGSGGGASQRIISPPPGPTGGGSAGGPTQSAPPPMPSREFPERPMRPGKNAPPR